MIGIFVIDGCELFLNRPYIAAALIACCAVAAGAQATATVPPNDPVYAFVDRLLAAGLADTIIVGQRSMSRREIGRILNEARRRLPPPSGDSTWLARSVTRYANIYPDGVPRAVWAHRYGAELTVADSRERTIEPDANGAVDVLVNPLLSNRLGRPHVDHFTLNTFAGLDAGVAPWLAIGGTGRASLIADAFGGVFNRADAEQLYARALLRNVSVQVGRDYVFLGQSMNAGLTNSLNPRGLDMIRLATDRPFVLPWLLRYAGPMQGTAYLADLGAKQNYPHARLFSYKLSARPFQRFELGATVAEQVGGKGAPPGTFLQKAADAFPLIDALFLHRNFQFSNKFVGMDARLRVPAVDGLQLYMEGMFDDFDIRRVKSVFTEDAGYIWGASLDRLKQDGAAKITAEYHATGIRYYTHALFRSGYTLDRQFIGDQLGPRGKAAYVTADVDRLHYGVRLDVAHEIRSGDKYGAVSTTPDDSDFRFIIIARNPAERRWRSVVTATRGHPAGRGSAEISAGVEHVENFGFQLDRGRTNWMTRVGFEIRPQRSIFR